jgi:hypothetical protein
MHISQAKELSMTDEQKNYVLDVLTEYLITMGIPQPALSQILQTVPTTHNLRTFLNPLNSMNDPQRRILSDGEVVSSMEQLRVNGGRWAVFLTITPKPLHVRIDRIAVTTNDGFPLRAFLDAMARLIYQDTLADATFTVALGHKEIASFWLAGKVHIGLPLGTDRWMRKPVVLTGKSIEQIGSLFSWRRRKVRGLTAFNHFDGWMETEVPRVVKLLVKQHGPEVLSPWADPFNGDAMNRLGDYDQTLETLKYHHRRQPYSPDLEEAPREIRAAVLTHGKAIWEDLWK